MMMPAGLDDIRLRRAAAAQESEEHEAHDEDVHDDTYDEENREQDQELRILDRRIPESALVMLVRAGAEQQW